MTCREMAQKFSKRAYWDPDHETIYLTDTGEALASRILIEGRRHWTVESKCRFEEIAVRVIADWSKGSTAEGMALAAISQKIKFEEVRNAGGD